MWDPGTYVATKKTWPVITAPKYESPTILQTRSRANSITLDECKDRLVSNINTLTILTFLSKWVHEYTTSCAVIGPEHFKHTPGWLNDLGK